MFQCCSPSGIHEEINLAACVCSARIACREDVQLTWKIKQIKTLFLNTARIIENFATLLGLNMLIENTFHNIKYVVHLAAIFDPRNSMANTKIKCVSRENTSRFVGYFAACPRVFVAIHHFEYREDRGTRLTAQTAVILENHFTLENLFKDYRNHDRFTEGKIKKKRNSVKHTWKHLLTAILYID